MPKSRRKRRRLLRQTSTKEELASLESPYVVPMVSRAFEILELLRSGSPLSIDAISLKTGTAKSSVYRIIRTMLAHGYVSRFGIGQFVISGEKELTRVESRIEQIKNLLRGF
jgi:DNA-binding MarR family transcriptional regulator